MIILKQHNPCKDLCTVFVFVLLSYNLLSAQVEANLINPKPSTSNKYRAEDVGGRYGLNSAEISELYQDRDGFIWVGTQAGISRFDGMEFVNYVEAQDRPFGQIHAITQDSKGTMWVGGDEGLFYLENGRFYSTKLGDLRIRDLHLDDNHNLWIAGNGFIPFRVTSDQRSKIIKEDPIEIIPIVTDADWSEAIGALHTWAVDTDEDGLLWLGLDDRHAYYDGNQLHVTWIDTTDLYEFVAIAAINRDSVYWGCEDIGLLLQTKDRLEMLTEKVTSMIAETDTSMYIMTSEELIEFKDGQWTILHSLDEYGFEFIYPRKLLLDREGNFWIGGVGNLLKLTPAYLQSWVYPVYHNLLSNHGISGMSNGDVLIGSFRGQVFEKTLNDFRLIHKFDVPNYSYVADIETDSRGWTWYVTSASGIICDQKGQLTYYSTENGLADNSQLFLYKNNKGELWAGGELGITRIRIDAHSKIHFENYLAEMYREEPPMFRDMFEGPDGTVWAVSDHGLYRLEGKKLVKYHFSGSGFPSPVITGSVLDEDNKIWLSTQGHGLWQCRFDKNSKPVFTRAWSSADGLTSNVILDVHIDRLGRVWMAAQNGLSYLTLTDTITAIRTIDLNDGWPDLSTHHSELYESPEGKLWVMNFNSLVSVPLYDLPVNTLPPKSYIDEVELMGESENIFKYADNTKGIGVLPTNLELPHDKNFLHFSFTATSYTSPAKNRFEYRLVGLDREWRDAMNNRSATYLGLNPGSYQFEVKSFNNDGIESSSVATYSFLIVPPWYKTWWAYLLSIAVLIGGLYYYYQFQLSRKLAFQERNRLQQLDDFKTRFYANITHEFRTPLTVIGGMTEDLESQLPYDSHDKLHMIQRNTRKLLGLVNQMLDLSKLQVGKEEIDYRQQDVIRYIEYIVGSYSPIANSKNIGLQFYSEIDAFVMDLDGRKLEMILNNLISNAIKFTPAYGNILVVATALEDEMKIEVKDSGIGISKEQLPYIFERYHQADPAHSEEGSGVGLAIVKELLKIMEGRIAVKSQPGKGSTFTMYLPVHFDAPLSDDTSETVTLPLEFQEPRLITPNMENEETPMLLLVEDNDDVANYISVCLGDEYRLIHRRNGKQGWTTATDVIPDIIISDVMMPEMDGFEFCDKIKTDERTNHIPIILLTAMATAEDRITGLKCGADAYLTKPFEKEEILVRLSKLMELRAILQKKYKASINNEERIVEREVKPHPFVKKAEKIITDHLDDEEFSILDFARLLNFSLSQTNRKLKALTGMSTAIFIRYVRLEQAKILLKDESLNISDVAYQTGFKTPVYFSQAFKETYGKSPTEYRSKIE